MNPENDKLRALAQDPPTKQPSLAETIINDLNEIIDNSISISNQLEQLEIYIFGDKPSNEKGDIETKENINSWESEILKKLNYIKSIVTNQQQTLNIISKFHK